MIVNHKNHQTAEKNTAYRHSSINQTKPKYAENSGTIVRVGITNKFSKIFIKNIVLALLILFFRPVEMKRTMLLRKT